ncbi:hypothetical protein HWV62_1414 [Athelia sp. TMB]|nr:hypothetical protein HWV62_1414 [Athelia sp. TMB]
MSLTTPSLSPRMFSKKRSNPLLAGTPPSAASYLAALSRADRDAQARSPPGTPALSFSSSATADSVLEDPEDDATGLLRPREPPTSAHAFTTVHAEFGHCANDAFRYTSAYVEGEDLSHADVEPPYYILLSTYASYLLLIVIGHLRDMVGKRFRPHAYRHLTEHQGYAPLNSDFDSFYIRRLKLRINDCFSQPITGVAGRTLAILDRTTRDYNATLTLAGTTSRTLNISSYNYLGFAQARGGCADAVEGAIQRYGVGALGARLEGGTGELHVQAEALVARFVGMEAAAISSMGYATNATFLPALVSPGCLVISDELNHASIRIGVRLSGASVRMFKHNDMRALEALLREVISQGQPKTHRPWKTILLVVEGLYSMEGTMVDLPGILALKQRYKVCTLTSLHPAQTLTRAQFSLFIDEAHSIGAIGPHGRGVCDYFGIDPAAPCAPPTSPTSPVSPSFSFSTSRKTPAPNPNVDVLMGTFTKSFGAAGGYVAGSRALIDSLRVRGHGGPYAEGMAPPVLAQVVSSMASIMGVAPAPVPTKGATPTLALTQTGPGRAPADALPAWMKLPPAQLDGSEGAERLRRLAFNARYLSRGLRKLGFIVYGHAGSPIVPLLVFNPGKLPLFHRLMKDRLVPIVVVVVSYPATALVYGRVRFCVSAAHTKGDVDAVLGACDEIGELLDLKHGLPRGERWALEEITARAVELVNMEM